MDDRPFPWGAPRGWTGPGRPDGRQQAPRQAPPRQAPPLQAPPTPVGRPIPRTRLTPRRLLRGTAKVGVALLAAAVLGTSWYGWSQLQRLTDSLASGGSLQVGASTPIDDQNILLLGLDARTDAQGNPLPQPLLDQLHAGDSSTGEDKSDTMIVLRISDRGRKAVGVSIPRDSYVELGDGSGKHKINTAYTAGKRTAAAMLQARGVTGPELEVQAAEQGAKAAIKTVEQFTGLTINHYAAVNLAGFYSIAQAVGGIPVCLNAAVRDRTYSGADFPAGPQTIDGVNVLAFIRQRHELANGDLDRVRRQQALLAGLADAVVSGGTLTDSSKLDSVLAAAKTAVSVDEGWDAGGLIQLLQRVGGGQVEFTTIPVLSLSLQTPFDGDAVQVDPTQVRAFFQAQTRAAVDDSRPSAVAPSGSAAVSVPPEPITAGGRNCVN